MKAIKGHKVKKSKSFFFFNHYCSVYDQEAFPQPEKSSKAQKADVGHQRSQIKKWKSLILSIIIAYFILSTPSLSLKK